MFSTFISRLILLRQFSILENEFKILGTNFYFQPINQLLIFQKKLGKNFGKKGINLIYETGKQSFIELIKDIEKFADKREKFFEVIFNFINHLGFGSLKILEINEKELKAIVEIKNNNFANLYVKKFGFQKECVDYFLAGILAGYFSKFFDKNVDCKEESCIAKKDQSCRFIIKKAK
ncbi:MAG: 4-vinyl reductase [Candidatus Aenigmatarchaeota archaeon]